MPLGQPVDLTLTVSQFSMQFLLADGGTELALEVLYQTIPDRYVATLGILHDFQKPLIAVMVRWSSPHVPAHLDRDAPVLPHRLEYPIGSGQVA
jgi:hypothetical protein